MAAEWRIKQLEYSWIDNMTVHRARRDFAACTADALDYVLARHSIDGRIRSELLTAYERLDAYEVPNMLATLRRHGFRLAILSNGTPKMLLTACQAAGISALLDVLISVEQAASFKPAPAVYGLAQTELVVTPARTLFVSGNPWDSQAALAKAWQWFGSTGTATPMNKVFAITSSRTYAISRDFPQFWCRRQREWFARRCVIAMRQSSCDS